MIIACTKTVNYDVYMEVEVTDELIKSLIDYGVDFEFDELKNIPTYTAKGHFSAPECYQWHRQLVQDRQSEYDPRIAGRILKGRDVMAWEYAELIHLRQRAMQDAARAFA